MITKKRQYFDVILGIFVVVSLLVLISLVFLIGRERRLFDTSVDIEAHFPNAAGLTVGADVMLAGVVVGHVGEIRFPILRSDMPGLSRDVTVVMRISHRKMNWIREDSTARIDSKGLLGDKIINISIGSPELPMAKPGAMLTSTPPMDFNKALEQASQILESVTETVSDAKDVFKGFISEGGDVSLAKAAKSLEAIIKEVEVGEGVLHQLIFDKESGKNAKKSIVSLDEGLISLNHMLREVKNGSGIMHELIYAKDQGQLIKNLNKIAKDLESVSNDLNEGRGSLGLLLKDPGIYHQIYGLLGDLRRNRLLKAIIRYSISKDDKSIP